MINKILQFSFIAVLCISLLIEIGAQDITYTFDGEFFADDMSYDPEFFGEENYECGVVGDALLLDGNMNRISFPDTLKELFENDFSISFYLSPTNREGIVDILSYRTTCDKDSSLSIIYTPDNQRLIIEVAENFQNIYELESRISQDRCWTHIALSKIGLQYILFIDGEVVDVELVDREVPFGKNAKIWLANSPCLVFTQERISGRIDELVISGLGKGNIDVSESYFAPDRILSRDTTIFAGEQVQIEMGSSCAFNIIWEPDTGISDNTILEPVITGVTTTDYVVTLSSSTCISKDTIRINVVDPEDLTCSDLLLPNVFTPNNDFINDNYGISNQFIVDELVSWKIYDRWGEVVFIGSTKNDTWDGSFKGSPVNPGMYLYKISYTCGNQEYTSVNNFSVLR